MILSSRFDHCEKSAVLPGGDYNEKGLSVLFEAESPREPLSGPQGTAGLLGDSLDSQDHQGISMRYDASMYSGGSPVQLASLTTDEFDANALTTSTWSAGSRVLYASLA